MQFFKLIRHACELNARSRGSRERSRGTYFLRVTRKEYIIIEVMVIVLLIINCFIVDSGGPVVLISPLDPRFAGSNPAVDDGSFSELKNPEYDFLWKGSKAVGPCRRFMACKRTSNRN